MPLQNLNSRIAAFHFALNARLILFPVAVASLLVLASCGKSQPPDFSGEDAFLFLEEQCAFGPRYPGSDQHRAVQRYLAKKLEEFGANLSLQPFDGILSTGDTLHLVNIIGNYNMKAKKRILLGAHYDTRPMADMDPDPARRNMPIEGANDGASGVAVLLQVAKLLGETPPPVGVDIVLFDGEDYGDSGVPRDFILGSAHFALNLRGYRPAAVIILDMIGEKDLSIPMEGYSAAASPVLLAEIYDIAERLGYSQFSREEGHTIIDDHLPFIQAGLPAVDLIDFDYRYWHTIEDTVDKCSPLSLEAVGNVVMEYIWQQD